MGRHSSRHQPMKVLRIQLPGLLLESPHRRALRICRWPYLGFHTTCGSTDYLDNPHRNERRLVAPVWADSATGTSALTASPFPSNPPVLLHSLSSTGYGRGLTYSTDTEVADRDCGKQPQRSGSITVSRQNSNRCLRTLVWRAVPTRVKTSRTKAEYTEPWWDKTSRKESTSLMVSAPGASVLAVTIPYLLDKLAL